MTRLQASTQACGRALDFERSYNLILGSELGDIMRAYLDGAGTVSYTEFGRQVETILREHTGGIPELPSGLGADTASCKASVTSGG